jgi:hypothetical protein
MQTITISRDAVRNFLPREAKTRTVDAVCPVEECHQWLTSRGLNGHGVNACADAVMQHLYDRHGLGTGDALDIETANLSRFVPGPIEATGPAITIEVIDHR